MQLSAPCFRASLISRLATMVMKPTPNLRFLCRSVISAHRTKQLLCTCILSQPRSQAFRSLPQSHNKRHCMDVADRRQWKNFKPCEPRWWELLVALSAAKKDVYLLLLKYLPLIFPNHQDSQVTKSNRKGIKQETLISQSSFSICRTAFSHVLCLRGFPLLSYTHSHKNDLRKQRLT